MWDLMRCISAPPQLPQHQILAHLEHCRCMSSDLWNNLQTDSWTGLALTVTWKVLGKDVARWVSFRVWAGKLSYYHIKLYLNICKSGWLKAISVPATRAQRILTRTVFYGVFPPSGSTICHYVFINAQRRKTLFWWLCYKKNHRW